MIATLATSQICFKKHWFKFTLEDKFIPKNTLVSKNQKNQ